MYTKSIIQQNIEIINAKNEFKDTLKTLMEKYHIVDCVFAYSKNGVKEVVEGYFAIENEYADLNEAISHCSIHNMCVRVLNNERFQVGTIHQFISECDNNKKVFDLERLEDVR